VLHHTSPHWHMAPMAFEHHFFGGYPTFLEGLRCQNSIIPSCLHRLQNVLWVRFEALEDGGFVALLLQISCRRSSGPTKKNSLAPFGRDSNRHGIFKNISDGIFEWLSRHFARIMFWELVSNDHDVCMYDCMYICLYGCMSVSVSLYLCISVALYLSLSIYLSIYLSIDWSIYRSIDLSI
jgi:hypothetical protein